MNRPNIYAQNESSEVALMGAALVDGSLWPDIAATVKRDDLFLERHKVIFDAYAEVHAAGDRIDLVTVSRKLGDRLETIGGPAYLMGLQNDCPLSFNWPAYARAVLDTATERRMAAALLDAGRAIDRGDFGGAGKILQDADELQITPDAGLSLFPALPDDVRLDPDLGRGAGAWISDYVEHASTISPMTPLQFHEAAALVIAAAVIARRLKVPMSFADIFPNLYVVLIAQSTLWTKTTSMDIARRLLLSVTPHLLAVRDSTIEALLSDMAGLEPSNFHTMSESDRGRWQAERNFAAQRTSISDEMSSLLASTGKDYNTGFLEILLKLYDNDELITRSTRGQGRIVVRNSSLSMLGASTPVALAPHLNAERLWVNGWWARFVLLSPETDRPAWKLSESHDAPELAAGLKRLYERLPLPAWPEAPQARTVLFGTGVHEAWARFDKAMRYDLLTPSLSERLLPVYGRLPTQLLKVATILAALDWGSGDAPVIELPHMARAMSIVEAWRAGAHRVLALATQSAFTGMRRRLITIIGGSPGGASYRDIVRAMGDREPSDIKVALDQLVEIGEVAAAEVRPGSRVGRPTQRYRLA